MSLRALRLALAPRTSPAARSRRFAVDPSVQRRLDRRELASAETLGGHDHHVARPDAALVEAKPLAQAPLHVVAGVGSLRGFFAHGQTQARPIPAVADGVEFQAGQPNGLGAFEAGGKLGGFGEPALFAEPEFLGLGAAAPRLGCVRAVGQTDSDLRPLARRRARTLRPFFVLERTKKPWVRWRRILEGW